MRFYFRSELYIYLLCSYLVSCTDPTQLTREGRRSADLYTHRHTHTHTHTRAHTTHTHNITSHCRIQLHRTHLLASHPLSGIGEPRPLPAQLRSTSNQWRSQDMAVARARPLLGHSMGTLRLYEFELPREVQKLMGDLGASSPLENLGILQPPWSVLRPYTVAKCKSLTANSRMMSV